MDFQKYFVGKRVYKTDGSVMFVDDARNIDAERVAVCERVADKTLEKIRDKNPVFISVDYLREVINGMSGNVVAVYIGAPDEPLVFVSNEKQFAFIMPVRVYDGFKFPSAAQPAREPDASPQPASEKSE